MISNISISSLLGVVDPEESNVTIYFGKKTGKPTLQIDGLVFNYDPQNNVFVDKANGVVATPGTDGNFIIYSIRLYQQLSGSKISNEGKIGAGYSTPLVYPQEPVCPDKDPASSLLEARLDGAETVFTEPEVGLPKEIRSPKN